MSFLASDPFCSESAITRSHVYSCYSMEAVVYFNIRVEKEGINLEVLEGDMGFVANATYEANVTHEASGRFEDKPELV